MKVPEYQMCQYQIIHAIFVPRNEGSVEQKVPSWERIVHKPIRQ